MSAAIVLVHRAMRAGKPRALEKLDFSRKKGQRMEANGVRYAQMRSSRSYQKIHDTIQSRATKEGVALMRIHPAFTSVLGRINSASR